MGLVVLAPGKWCIEAMQFQELLQSPGTLRAKSFVHQRWDI